MGDVQPIGNHTAGRVHDVQRLRVLLSRTRQDHAVGISVRDVRSIDGDVLRGGCIEADCALYVLNDVAAAGFALGFRLYVAGRKAGRRRGCVGLCLTLVVSGRRVA